MWLLRSPWSLQTQTSPLFLTIKHRSRQNVHTMSNPATLARQGAETAGMLNPQNLATAQQFQSIQYTPETVRPRALL